MYLGLKFDLRIICLKLMDIANRNQISTDVRTTKDPKLTSICFKVSYLKIVEFETDSYNGFCSPSKL